MKTNLTRMLKGAILCLALLAAAAPFAALAQAGTPTAPNGANPARGVGMNPFQRPQVDDGPTDGKDHPNYHISTPIKCKLAYSYCTTIDVSARIDRQAGFRLEGTTLSYQNYSIDPEKSADAAPVLFGGKFAEDVSVNDSKNKWTNLLQPFRNAFASQYRWSDKTFDPSFDTDISFQPGGCEITVDDHAKSLEVIATNPKAEPTRFKFNLSNGDPSFDPAADRKKHDEEEARKDASREIINPRPATEATSSTDGTAHPNTVTVAPVKIASFDPERKIVIRGTVDQTCGFQIKGNTLSYLNSKATTIDTGGFTGGFAVDASKLTFRGKYASGVTVNGEPWTCLNRPVALNTTLKEHSAKHITFKGPSCSFQYRKCGDAVAFFIGNYDKNAYQDKPAQFEIVVYFADETPDTQP